MADPLQRFYKGDLHQTPADVERVRRALQRGPFGRKELFDVTGLSQNRTLCAVGALIAAGHVVYDAAVRRFSVPQGG